LSMEAESQTGQSTPLIGTIPLVVDMDGTLTPVDTLHEMLALLVKEQPLAVLQAAGWVFGGKASFKSKIADRVALDATLLPYNERVLGQIEKARTEGRPVILATASDRRVADAVAGHLGVFDDVIGSDGARNLSSGAKRDALIERFGQGGFDYIGNDAADLPVWEAARQAILVNAPSSVVAEARKRHPDATILSPRAAGSMSLVKAARAYQWSKNFLIFVPILAAQKVSLPLATQALFAFLCISAAASSIYLINDILDLEADRRHPRKRNRPFASGRAPLSHGLVLSVLLILGALVGSLFITPAFTIALLGYLFITLNYSIWIKRFALLDVVVLAGLYTLRIIAGGAATNIEMTLWLLAFSMFLFTSLAFAKRYSEVVELLARDEQSTPGRGYRAGDQNVLMSIGTASGMASVLTLALYLNSATASGLYAHPEYLWMVCPLLLYWISRIWLAAQRERLTDDPIVFAFSDKASRGVFILALIPIAMAIWL
jgi:4-hydroxybenzoate polyprenyltransferase/phosphoserine phosphatase